jgi:hypothetical protein
MGPASPLRGHESEMMHVEVLWKLRGGSSDGQGGKVSTNGRAPEYHLWLCMLFTAQGHLAQSAEIQHILCSPNCAPAWDCIFLRHAQITLGMSGPWAFLARSTLETAGNHGETD